MLAVGSAIISGGGHGTSKRSPIKIADKRLIHAIERNATFGPVPISETLRASDQLIDLGIKPLHESQLKMLNLSLQDG